LMLSNPAVGRMISFFSIRTALIMARTPLAPSRCLSTSQLRCCSIAPSPPTTSRLTQNWISQTQCTRDLTRFVLRLVRQQKPQPRSGHCQVSLLQDASTTMRFAWTYPAAVPVPWPYDRV
jgi:hypothetical protein